MRTEYDRGIMVEMMERFPNPTTKNEVPTSTPDTLSASELADVMRASARKDERVETGTIDVAQLRDALENARRNPVSI